MPKKLVRYTDYFALTMQRMREDGLLLVTTNGAGTPNVMTIGWGMVGSVWSRPIFTVLVRPSRFTYSRLEEVNDFTVNVPPRELAGAAGLCGAVSGREHNKFDEANLTPYPSREVRSPIIQQCVVHYECRTLERVDMSPETLAQTVAAEFYATADYHRIYMGEIVAVYADEDATERLKAPGSDAFRSRP